MHDLKLPHNPLSDFLFGLDVYDLPCHHNIPALMSHFSYRAAVACTEFFDHIQVFALKIQLELNADLQHVRTRSVALVASLSVGGGRFGGWWGGCAEGQTLDVLALHRLGFESVC